LNLEYFVDSIFYHGKDPGNPSVLIGIRNGITHDDNKVETVIINSQNDLRNAFQKLFADESKIHKTSLVMSLAQYRQSNIKIGDRLELGIKINNKENFSE